MAYKYSRPKRNCKTPPVNRVANRKKQNDTSSAKTVDAKKRSANKVQEQVSPKDPEVTTIAEADSDAYQIKRKRISKTPVDTESMRMTRRRILESKTISPDHDKNISTLARSTTYALRSCKDSVLYESCDQIRRRKIPKQSQNYVPTGLRVTRLSSSFYLETPAVKPGKKSLHEAKADRKPAKHTLPFCTLSNGSLHDRADAIGGCKKNINISIVPEILKENLPEVKTTAEKPSKQSKGKKEVLKGTSKNKRGSKTKTAPTVDCITSVQITKPNQPKTQRPSKVHKRKRNTVESKPGNITKSAPTIDCIYSTIHKEKPCRKTLPQILPSKPINKRGKSTGSLRLDRKEIQRPVKMRGKKKDPATPDLSKLPFDEISMCLATDVSITKPKRCRSAPAGIKQKKKDSILLPNGQKMSLPAKGTLKRKRLILNALKEKSDGYEDDIFANQILPSAFNFPLMDDESDITETSIATPKFGCMLSPAFKKKTPRYKDCISPSDLVLARKNAEEYIYRRNKNRGNHNYKQKVTNSFGENSRLSEDNSGPEKKKLEFEKALNKLAEVEKIVVANNGHESDQDDYFSDASV